MDIHATTMTFANQIRWAFVWASMLAFAMCSTMITSCAKEQAHEVPTSGTPSPTPSPAHSIGWNPATMRCQDFDNGKFHGEFHPDEDCADQQRPKALAE